jgi:membrane protein DedA with SNARE-associated domain
MDLILKLLHILEPYGHFAYAIIILLLLACGFGLPMPEDVILITGGILSSRGITSFTTTVAVSLIGVIIGDGIVFTIGRRLGPRLKISRFYRTLMARGREARIENLFKKYGNKVIFFARFTPGLRMPLFLTAGIYQVARWKFVALDGFAALISVPAWVWAGHFFGSNLEVLEHKLRQMKMGLYSVLGGALLLFIIYYLVMRKIKQKVSSDS